MPHVGIVIMAIGSYQNGTISLWVWAEKAEVVTTQLLAFHYHDPNMTQLCRAVHCCFNVKKKRVHQPIYSRLLSLRTSSMA